MTTTPRRRPHEVTEKLDLRDSSLSAIDERAGIDRPGFVEAHGAE
jgi:hypothetical protein